MPQILPLNRLMSLSTLVSPPLWSFSLHISGENERGKEPHVIFRMQCGEQTYNNMIHCLLKLNSGGGKWIEKGVLADPLHHPAECNELQCVGYTAVPLVPVNSNAVKGSMLLSSGCFSTSTALIHSAVRGMCEAAF